MSDTASAYLEVNMNGEIRRFPLDNQRVYRIGRSEASNIVLDDDLVSRNHSMVQRSDSESVYLTDLGSRNGTFVNGGRISVPVILRRGDRILIGSHEFTFYQENGIEPPPTEIVGDDLKSTNVLFARKLITVLVIDIRDFTGLGQRLDSDQLSQLTGTFFRRAGEVLQQHGAWAQKHIGDAVMAVWLHRSREPSATEFLNVFRGLARLAGIASTLQQEFDLAEPIRIGAGVNTGFASLGNFGSIASSDYTALGDVVNKAFRLESVTKIINCDLVAGEQTFQFLSAMADPGRLFRSSLVALKGYNEPATVYAGDLAAVSSVAEMLEAALAP